MNAQFTLVITRAVQGQFYDDVDHTKQNGGNRRLGFVALLGGFLPDGAFAGNLD